MQNKSIADIRKDYSKFSLDSSSIDQDPITQFTKWFDEAVRSEVTEPNAFTLSTVSEDGLPSARIVLLKGVENKKFIFYTNYQSRKGKELEKNPACALTFFWPELERQVRIEGTATREGDELSEKYFQSRPRESQIGAWASPQSTLIANRKILEERVNQMQKKFEGQEKLPKPKQWGGFEVDPFRIEFWQGRPSRLHDRLLFTKIDGLWQVHRLAP
ncbi:MAG: Pyridoxamine 5'-phosphate oxidase [Cytophagales bacterium]|mgnify:CR=1 FL=1|jgi:pyridoxamine 5'-phosphate oxidase|nr:pyridoxamine 5'-phosphate oxidase [Bacteroidota bacterium]MBS1981677.1 pyridoxamine 5'-phosphate oxidase [Bacteroidota bacterium]WHZ08987.1 MAG: Pyridoxamine 5'-phosphate oxidase [Cytophagales bacterium]